MSEGRRVAFQGHGDDARPDGPNRAYEGIDRMTGGLLLGYTDGENNR